MQDGHDRYRRATPAALLFLWVLRFGVQPLSAQEALASRGGERFEPSQAATLLQRSGTGGPSEESIYDRIWRFANWYDNPANPFVQRVLFSGRFQHELATVSADQGSHDEWNVRRLRLGPRITFLRTLTFHSEVELNPQERNPLYVRFTDFYVQWVARPSFAVTVGKHGVPFTIDGATSSKELLTIDRNNLSNNLWFPQEYIPGLSVSGVREAWTYRFGVYSAGEANREFGKFNGGVFTLTSLGYDFAEALGVDEALLMGNYVYQTADPRNTFTQPLRHVGSLNLKLEAQRWGLRGDVSAATGYGDQGDLWGVMLMPFYNASSRLQFVGRYTFLGGSEVGSVRLATYENRVVGSRGDRYAELYLGGGYYFYGHKLKVQSGLQIASLTSLGDTAYSGVAWTTGLRVSW